MILYYKNNGTMTRMCECKNEKEAFQFIHTFLDEQLHFKSYYYNIHGEVNNGGKVIDFGSWSRFFILMEE